MIYAGPNKREAQRDIYGIVKVFHLEGNEALIVVHAHYGIEFVGLMK